jgi:hypothetical protein
VRQDCHVPCAMRHAPCAMLVIEVIFGKILS